MPTIPKRGAGLYQRYAEAFAAWCDAEDLASEFASLHPFMADHQRKLIGSTIALRQEKDVVFIDLTQGEEGILGGINRGHRSSINKASRANVQVRKVEPTGANLAIFNEIYRQTMVRRNAAARWFVPDTFFSNCCKHLGPDRVSLFFAFVGSVVECAYLLMHDFGVAYYHFAGTRAQFPDLRANNLTMYETALWAQKAGYSPVLPRRWRNQRRARHVAALQVWVFQSAPAALHVFLHSRQSGIRSTLRAKTRLRTGNRGRGIPIGFCPPLPAIEGHGFRLTKIFFC